MTYSDDGWDELLNPFGEPVPAERPPTRAIPIRWCLLALGLALVLAAAGVAAQQYRSRTITTTTVVSSGGFASVDLTGCPIGTDCSYGSQPGAQLLQLIEVHFPRVEQLSASIVFDIDTASNYRSSVLATVGSGITVLVTAQCVPRGDRVSPWRSSVPTVGPADVAVVLPGPVRGCSVAVTAHVPAGVAVPARALAELADEPGLSSS